MVLNRINGCFRSLAAAAVALSSTVALAQEKPAEPVDPNTGAVSLLAGVDFTTAYYFRGIAQDNQGLIVQPWGTVSLKLYEGESPLNSIALSIGTWNSLHEGPSGLGDASDSGKSTPKLWYESDFIASVDIGFADVFTFSTIYTAYMSPNSSFDSVQEIALKLAYNDADLMKGMNVPFVVSPYVLVAFETEGQTDAGQDHGTYLEVGITPTIALIESDTMPITLKIPLVAGFSLDNYYEDPVTGDDDFFGYFSAGVLLEMPLKFVPEKFGAWTFNIGVSVVFLGDNVQELSRGVNGADDNEIIGRIGFSMSY